ncbi:sulfotransferase domain-containing protein [Candidatus Pelagibacter sp.]|nr:sulfotransferase domain-containing protein [Candidatus Pelagibacter sp.]
MVIWIASYPKSGNTWLRSLVTSYYFSKDKFSLSDLKKIPTFSVSDFINDSLLLQNGVDVAKQWLNVQREINKNYKKTLFFKTHNACVAINKNLFTDSDNTAGCIYVVRDPRNIITSYKNFEKKTYEEILNHMKNKEAFLFSERKTGFKNFEFIGSWADNYNSWFHNKLGIPICLIKYEDLVRDTLGELRKIIDFIASVQNIKNYSFNNEKAEKGVSDSSFENLSKMERDRGFNEARYDQKFFSMGGKNKWQTLLPVSIKENIEQSFYSEMKELNYLN